ncbi:hypothetical protein LIER_32538 [Lithospermum erythrorhizon]|uniref:Uncharacterized protein n=1 Tax=Lithospermum erythrorhizon TaxID=34254 RepID=A0AAV3RX89_LITER
MQARYKELELANAGEIMRMIEAFQKDKETTLTYAAVAADKVRVQFAKETLRSFLNSPNYEAKVGRECVAYFANIVTHLKDHLQLLRMSLKKKMVRRRMLNSLARAARPQCSLIFTFSCLLPL